MIFINFLANFIIPVIIYYNCSNVMKNWKKIGWRSPLKMSRQERIASISLLCVGIILVFLLLLRKHAQEGIFITNIKPLKYSTSPYPDNNESNTISELHPFPFDPNTLDSLGFSKLGLREKTIKMIMNYRKKGGHFYKSADFAKVWTLSEQEFNQLETFIQLSANENNIRSKSETVRQIDWNNIDSATLTKVNGIGPYIAHKLISYRKLLGGYIHSEQLLEAYKLKDSLYNYIVALSVFNSAYLKKIPINTITEQELSKHPYIGDKMAKNIILLRSSFNKFDKIEQLKQVPLMNEEKYRKIAPYIQL